MTPILGKYAWKQQRRQFLRRIIRFLYWKWSQDINKQEQSPLFAPEDNLQWAHGAPNQSDFVQSRINPSMRMANVKPFEEQKLHPD